MLTFHMSKNSRGYIVANIFSSVKIFGRVVGQHSFKVLLSVLLNWVFFHARFIPCYTVNPDSATAWLTS